MAEFECTQCGRCCMGMGRYVTVEQRLPGSRVYGRHALGKETFFATIKREFREKFDEDTDDGDRSGWCPFLARSAGTASFVCIIHHERPRFCRRYRCCVMRITGPDGRAAGTVKGRRDLVASDPGLRDLWERTITPLFIAEEREWLSEVKSRLIAAGYGVTVYD
ncbi:MAG: YkgJ family cysteine cluster protein [Methanomicrobiales archaeon]|nr:YkgJ family cysteine cluster protein [Methanomicrobiales archaeon]